MPMLQPRTDAYALPGSAAELVDVLGLSGAMNNDDDSASREFRTSFDSVYRDFPNIRFDHLLPELLERDHATSAQIFCETFWTILRSDVGLFEWLQKYLNERGTVLHETDPALIESKIPFNFSGDETAGEISDDNEHFYHRISELRTFCRHFAHAFSEHHGSTDSERSPSAEYSFASLIKNLGLEAFFSGPSADEFRHTLERIQELFPHFDFGKIYELIRNAPSADEFHQRLFWAIFQSNSELHQKYAEDFDREAIPSELLEACDFFQAVFLCQRFGVPYNEASIGFFNLAAERIRDIERKAGPFPYAEFQSQKHFHKDFAIVGSWLASRMQRPGIDPDELFGVCINIAHLDFQVAPSPVELRRERIAEKLRAAGDLDVPEPAGAVAQPATPHEPLPVGIAVDDDPNESQLPEIDDEPTPVVVDDLDRMVDDDEPDAAVQRGFFEPAEEPQKPPPMPPAARRAVAETVVFHLFGDDAGRGLRQSIHQLGRELPKGLSRPFAHSDRRLVFASKPNQFCSPGIDVDEEDRTAEPDYLLARPRIVDGEPTNLCGLVLSKTAQGFVESSPRQHEEFSGVYVSDKKGIYAVGDSFNRSFLGQAFEPFVGSAEDTDFSSFNRAKAQYDLEKSNPALALGLQFMAAELEAKSNGKRKIFLYRSSPRFAPLIYLWDDRQKKFLRRDFDGPDLVKTKQGLAKEGESFADMPEAWKFELPTGSILVLPNRAVAGLQRERIAAGTDLCSEAISESLAKGGDALPAEYLRKKFCERADLFNKKSGAVLFIQV